MKTIYFTRSKVIYRNFYSNNTLSKIYSPHNTYSHLFFKPTPFSVHSEFGFQEVDFSIGDLQFWNLNSIRIRVSANRVLKGFLFIYLF